jgi:hypothetical protein
MTKEMANRQSHGRRSAGTVYSPLDAARVFIPGWRKRVQASDLAAIDRGEPRTVLCWFRGLYGNYRRKFYIYFLDMTSAGPVLRKNLLFWERERIPITEGLVSASLRPPASPQEARRVRANGTPYGSGGPMDVVGRQIISCETTEGIVEFAVMRTDVPLLLHYITAQALRPDS